MSDWTTSGIESDFDAVVTDDPVAFVHAGQNCSGWISDEALSRDQPDAGFIPTFDLRIQAKLSQFDSAPSIGDTFSALRGKSFQVVGIATDPAQAVATYDLDTIHK